VIERPHYRRYHFEGHDEFALCLGADHARQILIVPPLFDEMNRMRRVLAQAMRDLAARRVGTMLVDLPGCNESGAALEAHSLGSWRVAVAQAAGQLGATHVAAIRGGALVADGTAQLPQWRLNPAKGASLLKTMIRTRIAGDKESGLSSSEAELMATARTGAIELGGNLLGPAMVAELAATESAESNHVVSRILGQDIAGSPLWLRAEPQDDPELAAAIAADLDSWSAACGG
jgi:hypothetical protein